MSERTLNFNMVVPGLSALKKSRQEEGSSGGNDTLNIIRGLKEKIRRWAPQAREIEVILLKGPSQKVSAKVGFQIGAKSFFAAKSGEKLSTVMSKINGALKHQWEKRKRLRKKIRVNKMLQDPS